MKSRRVMKDEKDRESGFDRPNGGIGNLTSLDLSIRTKHCFVGTPKAEDREPDTPPEFNAGTSRNPESTN
jgi:hypothetical protein